MAPTDRTDGLCCAVLELRQYTLKPGQRDTLIDLFERHFIESQEALGISVAGHFRDRDRPDRFVWLRGFADMPSRHRALEAFYDGPVWAAHRDAANDTMLEFDDVRLLKPARPGPAWRPPGGGDAADCGRRASIVLAGIFTLPHEADASRVAEFERDVAVRLDAKGVRLQGVFVTETSPNTFTRLPVRDGCVLVWFGTTDDVSPRPNWNEALAALTLAGRPASVLTLEPAARSRTRRS